MDLSIIIVNYNTKDITSNCIDSIIENTKGISYEIILVDNSSSDGSKEYFSRNDHIKYIYSEDNLGFGRANNLALAYAKGRNIIFLNPDTLLINNALKILSDYLDNNPVVGVCGGNLFNEEMKPALSYRRIFPGILDELNNLFFRIPEKLYYYRTWSHNTTDTPLRVAHISGADLMISRVVIDNVGAFSPDFFMYYEETDLCYRICKAGYEIHSVPQACIKHLEGKSFKSVFDEKRIKASENGRFIFYSHNHSQKYHKIANIIAEITLSFHYLVYKLFGYDEAASGCRLRRNYIHKLRISSK